MTQLLRLSALLLATLHGLLVLANPNPQGAVYSPQPTPPTCAFDFNLPNPDRNSCPPGVLYDVVMSQWCLWVSMTVSYKDTFVENPSTAISTLSALYAAAHPTITAAPSSGILLSADIVKDPIASAAMVKRKANMLIGAGGDLGWGDIGTVYTVPIAEASKHSGVNVTKITDIIFIESKGDPIIFQGLTQIDYLAWGYMKDWYPELTLVNKYEPRSNIVASAMYLKNLVYQGVCTTFDICYTSCYQGGCAQQLTPEKKAPLLA